MAKDKKAQNKKGIKAQIQSKIGLAIIGVMTIITIVVLVLVDNLLISANNTKLQQDSESVSLQVEKYFAPFESMTQQLAIDKDVQDLLITTKAGDRMTDNALYNTVLDKMVGVANLETDNIQGVFIADLDSNASITSGGTIS
ncbi:MAG: hypothetical protein MRZ75_07970 [Roseburia sp.]|nr:hypothetical protein [Roseburia sp.]MDY5883163.1 hypothetical protein [Roseburia sp.]